MFVCATMVEHLKTIEKRFSYGSYVNVVRPNCRLNNWTNKSLSQIQFCLAHSFSSSNISLIFYKYVEQRNNTADKPFPGIAFYPHVFHLASLHRSKGTSWVIQTSGLLNDIFENNFNNLHISANKKRSIFISDPLEIWWGKFFI